MKFFITLHAVLRKKIGFMMNSVSNHFSTVYCRLTPEAAENHLFLPLYFALPS